MLPFKYQCFNEWVTNVQGEYEKSEIKVYKIYKQFFTYSVNQLCNKIVADTY